MKSNNIGGYQLGKDEGEDHRIESHMCFGRGDASYFESNDAKRDLGQIGESVYNQLITSTW